MSRVTYLAIYAHGYNDDFSACGTETIARCNKAIEYVKGTPGRHIIVLGGGIAPSAPNGTRPIKEIMKDYIAGKFDTATNARVPILLCNGNPWGTFAESISMMALISNSLSGERGLVIVSSKYHIPRIRLIWRLIKSSARHRFSISFLPISVISVRKDPWLEPIKMLKVLWLYCQSKK